MSSIWSGRGARSSAASRRRGPPLFGRIAGAVGQQAACLVDDRDAVGLEALDRGGGDEMADGAHLAWLELAADLQDDRGPRLLAVALEQLPLGQGEMHPRVLTRSSERMVRASSASAREAGLTFWTKLVAV